MDRADLREAAQHLDEVAALEPLATGGDELDECLARVPPFADDEVAQVAAAVLLRVRLEALLAGPVAHGVADRVAEVGREPAAFDLEDLVPASGLVEPERRAVLELGERVLELVAVVEDRLRGDDRLERRVGQAPDPAERVRDLRLLRGNLRLVGEILEPAAAAGRVVRTRRVDPLRARPEHLGCERLRMPPLHLGHSCADHVARQPSPHEDDEPVEPCDAVATVRERLDRQLDVLPFRNGSGHALSVAAPPRRLSAGRSPGAG